MAKRMNKNLTMVYGPGMPVVETSEDGDGMEGFVSSPMYSNTWSNPAERPLVRRRNWRKEEEDCG